MRPLASRHARPRATCPADMAPRSSIGASAASTPSPSSNSSTTRRPEMADEAPLRATTLAEKIRHLQGPILVLGASGFVGANLMRSVFAVRNDVYGTTTRKPAWRLEDLPDRHVQTTDLLIDSNLDALLDETRPR